MTRAFGILLLFCAAGCIGHAGGGSSSSLLLLLGLAGGSNAPVLGTLSISATTPASITLTSPTLTNPGKPAAKVSAYIGLDANLSISGSTLQNVIEGPVDVSSGSYSFSGLTSSTLYRIVVVAQNASGYSVQQITQSTGNLAPVLSALSITASDSNSITLAQPSFASAGNPLPSVSAYIGVNGAISVAGSIVSGAIAGPVDVSSGGKQFTGLASNTTYRIIVVASNSHGYSVQQIAQGTAGIAPVLGSLGVSSFDSASISLNQPAFSTAGNPTPTVSAYIGVNGTISVLGSNVSGELQGPVDVSGGGYQFSSLASNTSYRIIVIAQNADGYSVQQITQSTAAVAPVLSPLSISTSDTSSITLAQPSLSTNGNPSPTVKAYVGLSGTISVSGASVSGALQGPINVATGGYQFSSLSSNTSYRIIVVAQNSAGYSVQQIVQSTAAVAPVMSALSISTSDSVSISLSQPVFSTAGNPAPTVKAYIGIDGVISVTGAAVSNSLQGPIDVSTGGYQFSSLSSNTAYRIIVVAQNSAGSYVQQIVQSTAGIAPVVNSLSISATDSSSITLAQPTFATGGNPAPTVRAYIGTNGSISVSGSSVSSASQGPIDVSSGSYQFSGLSANVSYRIVVIAQNSAGYYVQQITQSTAGIAPVLNSLAISATDSSSITLSQPAFSTAGNPAPTVKAYIGLDGTISISGPTVSGSVQGPIDVSSGGYQFSSLNSYAAYRIIVIAQNSGGYSTQQITQSTAGIAPVLKGIVLSSYDSTSMTLSQPTFSTAGNPAPTVQTWIGLKGTISVSGTTVTNAIEGPINVISGGYQFSGLSTGSVYSVIVVAQNAYGNSVKQVTQSAPSTTATVVYGQPDMTSGGTRTVSASTLNAQGVILDANDNLYVADTVNHRVLFFPTGATAATRVYGQPDFNSNTPNSGGVSATSLVVPHCLALDSGGNLYVSDNNNRILVFPPGSTIATRVYGQPDMTSVQSGTSATRFQGPRGMAIDAADNLYVADYVNHRVLFFPAGTTAATRVYGQPDMTSNAQNNNGVSANSMSYPRGVTLDPDGNLYVADAGNFRILFFPAGSTTATRVYGQPNLNSNGSGVSASSLSGATDVLADAGGNLYVMDAYRVLYFPAGVTTATRVYGQPDMTSFSSNNGGISPTSLGSVYLGLSLDSSGHLYISDGGNGRVLVFP